MISSVMPWVAAVLGVLFVGLLMLVFRARNNSHAEYLKRRDEIRMKSATRRNR